MKKEERKTLLILLFGILIGLASFHLSGAPLEKKGRIPDAQSLEVFSKSLGMIQDGFVDASKTKARPLIYDAIRGMLKGLGDPHTRFLEPKGRKEMQVKTEGEFGGLGIVIGMEDDWLSVISPIEGTPAFKAGIETGDKIIKIEGKSTEGISLQRAVSKLRGIPGSKVKITVLRHGVDKPFDVEIVRAVIDIKSVKHRIFQKDIGYVRITEFSEHTTDDLILAIKDLNQKGMKAMILDLRGNPGGLLTAAIGVSDLFLDSGVIVSTKGRGEVIGSAYKASKNTTLVLRHIPIVDLINGGSASASEIVTGALKDHSRAVIMGTKSYGKGSVQTIKNLPDGSALVLTTAKYYTPSGISIDGTGIQPDVSVEQAAIPTEDLNVLARLSEKARETFSDFAYDHADFSDTDARTLQKKLKDQKISLALETVKKRLLYEVSRRHEGKLFLKTDLDAQLRQAVGVLRAMRIMEKNQ